MTDAKENLVMEHHVSLTYTEQLTPNLDRYVDALIDGRIVGHKCPECGRVYVPGKGYCPLCVGHCGNGRRGGLRRLLRLRPRALDRRERTHDHR
jgi:hypothetical protein